MEELTADIWLPNSTAEALFGAHANSTIRYATGESLWIPAAPTHHPVHGLRFPASGSLQQLQQLAERLLQHTSHLQTGGVLDLSPAALIWCYVDANSAQFGPYHAGQLQQFAASGMLAHDLPVCHEPSRMWLPLWLVLRLFERQPISAPAAAACGTAASAQSGSIQRLRGASPARQDGRGASLTPQQQPDRHRPAAAAPRAYKPSNAASAGAAGQEDDDEYGYGSGPQRKLHQEQHQHSTAWRNYAHAVSAASGAEPDKPPAQQKHHSKQQTQQSRQQQQQQHSTTWRGSTQADAQMLDDAFEAGAAGAAAAAAAAAAGVADMEVIDEVAKLRQDDEFLQELNDAIEMDWEQAHPASAAAANNDDDAALSVVQLERQVAAADSSIGSSSIWLQQQQHELLLLVLVVDTNVLVEADGLLLLKQLQQLQDLQGGCIHLVASSSKACKTSSPAAAQQQSAAAAVRVQVVVPWTVLVELDRLKLRSASVSDRAREAMRYLKATFGPVVSKTTNSSSSMIKMQTVEEYRQALQDFDFQVPPQQLTADDRILQCVMAQAQQLDHHQQQQQQQMQKQKQHGAPDKCSGVLLLSNDVMMQIKANANGLPAASLRDSFRPPPGPSASATQSARSTTPQHTALQQYLSSLLLPDLLHLSGINTAALTDAAMGNTVPLMHSSSSSSHVARVTASLQQRSSRAQQQQHQQPQQQQSVLAVMDTVSRYLTELRLALSDLVLGFFQADSGLGEFWLDVLVKKPPWTNNMDFMDVVLHHWSTLEIHLPDATTDRKRLHTYAEHLLNVAKRAERHRFGGLNTNTLVPVVAEEVRALVEAFAGRQAADAVAAKMSAAAVSTKGAASCALPGAAVATAVQSQQQQQQPHMALQEQQRDNQQDYQQQQHWQQQQQQQQLMAQQHALQHQHHQLVLQSQQHLVQHHQPALHCSASAAAADVLAVASAQVPVPSVVGPCLRLAQLLEYNALLLQAIFEPLGELLAPAGAQSPSSSQNAACQGSVSYGIALEQQLQQVTQQLETLGHYVGQQQVSQDADAAVLHLGLLLVQMCSGILNNAAAGASAAKQLQNHAREFVADAWTYLRQQHGQIQSPGMFLQLLKGALNHLHSLLMPYMA